MKWPPGLTRREYDRIGVRQWGAGRRRTSCGASLTARMYRYDVTWFSATWMDRVRSLTFAPAWSRPYAAFGPPRACEVAVVRTPMECCGSGLRTGEATPRPRPREWRDGQSGQHYCASRQPSQPLGDASGQGLP